MKKVFLKFLNSPAPKWMCRFINQWFARDLIKIAQQCEFHKEYRIAETLYRLAEKYKHLEE